MAVTRKPILLDETGQEIAANLIGIKNAVQPVNIYLDVQMSIPVEGWSGAAAPYTYNWLYSRITEECGVDVCYADGAEDVDMQYIEYEKIAGGIRFTINKIPDKAVPLSVRIINAQTTAVIDPVDSSLVTENAVPGAANVHEAMADHEERIGENEDGITDIYSKLGVVDEELAKRVKLINGEGPDEHGNCNVNETEFAHQIVTDDAQQSTGEFIFRTTGGDASLSDGPAKLVSISGRRVHTGESAEALNMAVNAAEREAPDPITAELDTETFEAYVSGGGVYTIIYTSSWSTNPTLYGITVTGDPEDGDTISISWDEINDPVMSVFAPRTAPPAITAVLNAATFKAYVQGSGVYMLSYDNGAWDANPALYGVTVSNTPVDGDEIVITYVQSDRGTITVSNPSKFVSTGWNLYDNAAGKKYARVKKYSTQYGFLIGGSYASLEFAETLGGSRTAITPASGYFTVPADGYVFVTGGDATTYIMMTWSDWTEGYEGEFEAYTESVVDLTAIMTQFPYGLMQVGAAADEINFSMMRAISRIERLAYSDVNLAYAQASGRDYEADTNYIYLIKALEDVYVISETGAYTASDHGVEFVDSDVAVHVETLYGQNMVDKLRTDVVTISQQTLSAAQKAQVQDNLGLVPTTATDKTTSGFVADARVTKTLSDYITNRTRHTRLTDFSLSDLQAAVADQNLEKHGLKVGDQKTINGHTYVIAGLNVMKGSHAYTCTGNHVGLIVIPHTTQAWNASGNTYTGANGRGAGYMNCDLQYYLENDVMAMCDTDLGGTTSHLYKHQKLMGNAINQSGYNRFGTNSGCTSGWGWKEAYISALTEAQVFGGDHWSSSGYDTGEANTLLPVFAEYKHTDIFGNEYPWLRNVSSASQACIAANGGLATGEGGVSNANSVAGLILYH